MKNFATESHQNQKAFVMTETSFHRSELSEGGANAFPGREWQAWRVRTGLAQECDRAMSQAGIYTDFT
ncbi:MAG: hypothetical protein WC352_06485 [Candidatus Omnitrophota bacterium]|jgi:hypothetical protein